MRKITKIAFGYSNRCNIRCRHCVAAEDADLSERMQLDRARATLRELRDSGVNGISFTAGEPFIYFDDLLELIGLCREYGMYTRVVSNAFWAGSREKAEKCLSQLATYGLNQLRLSYSRWHQEHVAADNVVNAARACSAAGVDYYVSFVTDFSKKDDMAEEFLRRNRLKFFPEPVIYSGRANFLEKEPLLTDYQDNRCSMNPYLGPDMFIYGCCDAGAQFSTTGFFNLGSLDEHSVDELLHKSEKSLLYNCIRDMGVTPIASFAGFSAREIVRQRKCDLCRKLFDDPAMLHQLEDAAASGMLQQWVR